MQSRFILALFAGLAPAPLWAEGLGGVSQIIDTPSAVTPAPDSVSIDFDFREDYRALSFGFQANERLQVGLSFPSYDIGPASSGNELSLGLTILTETDVIPSLTVGLVGLGTDDRGAGEYLAFGKSIGAFDLTAGAGWGRYADTSSATRGTDDDSFVTGHLFEGDAEPFAGVLWSPEGSRFTFGAEYSGLAGPEADDTFAASASFEVLPGFHLTGLANNQGSAGLRISYRANPNTPVAEPDSARGPTPYIEASPARARLDRATMLATAQERLEKEGIRITRFAITRSAIDVTVQHDTELNFAKTAGRTARVLSGVAPANMSTFRITQNTGAFDSNVIVLDRAALDQAISRVDAGARAWAATSFEASPIPPARAMLDETPDPAFTYGLRPVFSADFVTSDALELTGTVVAEAQYALSPQTSVQGSIGYRFLNQWDQTAPPAQPTVRSDLTAYAPDQVYLDTLTISHKFRLAPTVYSRVSAGLFERAYGGVSTEVIWRDPEMDFALGLEASFAQKRSYDDVFGFEDTDATTVIGSLYANIGDNGNFFILDTGQYLAGDFGVGMTIGRNYANGWRVAASTTWSEDSDAPLRFGAEVVIPMAWARPDGGREVTTLSVGGRSDDYGSRLSGTDRLYDELRASDRMRLKDGWGAFWN